MQTIILLASHLNCEERLTSIKYTLKSLASQTKLPDKVLISYSCNLEIHPCVEDWKTILQKIPHTILYQTQRTLQYAHFKKCLDVIGSDLEKYLVMFVDDDDLYHEDRVKIGCEYMEKIPDCLACNCQGSTFMWYPEYRRMVPENYVFSTDEEFEEHKRERKILELKKYDEPDDSEILPAHTISKGISFNKDPFTPIFIEPINQTIYTLFKSREGNTAFYQHGCTTLRGKIAQKFFYDLENFREDRKDFFEEVLQIWQGNTDIAFFTYMDKIIKIIPEMLFYYHVGEDIKRVWKEPVETC